MIKLIGVLIVIVGFALRINPIAIVLSAGIVTGLVGHMSIVKILETIGKTFIVNRNIS
jgi:uncharacterized membrane protein